MDGPDQREDAVCDLGEARNDPHFGQFWHLGFTTGGGYTDTVKASLCSQLWTCDDDCHPDVRRFPWGVGRSLRSHPAQSPGHRPADGRGRSDVSGIVCSLSGAQVVVKAKGTTTVTYHAVDRAGNAGQALTLQVRADQQCDSNRDGRLGMADFRGLMFSPRDRSSSIVGELNGDGVISRQEFEDCFRMIANTR